MEIAPCDLRHVLAQLFAQNAGRDLFDVACWQVGELERPE
jgi:hypothetical protein